MQFKLNVISFRLNRNFGSRHLKLRSFIHDHGCSLLLNIKRLIEIVAITDNWGKKGKNCLSKEVHRI